MRPKHIPAIVVVAQIVLSNICFMPMAYAQAGMPMDHAMPEMEQVTEIVMTPADAMSPQDCGGCVTITRPRHHSAAAGGERMPCNDGHCLSDHMPAVASAAQSSLKGTLYGAVFPAGVSVVHPLDGSGEFAENSGVTTRVSFARTVVLRQ